MNKPLSEIVIFIATAILS